LYLELRRFQNRHRWSSRQARNQLGT